MRLDYTGFFARVTHYSDLIKEIAGIKESVNRLWFAKGTGFIIILCFVDQLLQHSMVKNF